MPTVSDITGNRQVVAENAEPQVVDGMVPGLSSIVSRVSALGVSPPVLHGKAFEDDVPSSRVVLLPHANHFVFMSNEADVLREINSFLSSLPQKAQTSLSEKVPAPNFTKYRITGSSPRPGKHCPMLHRGHL
jgi:hypothetical protein